MASTKRYFGLSWIICLILASVQILFKSLTLGLSIKAFFCDEISIKLSLSAAQSTA